MFVPGPGAIDDPDDREHHRNFHQHADNGSQRGAGLQADEVWIWSDVDGILTADPNIVPQARTLQELSYEEAADLAYYGADVLHPKTIRPVIASGRCRRRGCNAAR